MDFGVHNRLHQPAFDTPAGKVLYFDRLQKELDLTPAQTEQIQSILNDFWQYYRTVLSEARRASSNCSTKNSAGNLSACCKNTRNSRAPCGPPY